MITSLLFVLASSISVLGSAMHANSGFESQYDSLQYQIVHHKTYLNRLLRTCTDFTSVHTVKDILGWPRHDTRPAYHECQDDWVMCSQSYTNVKSPSFLHFSSLLKQRSYYEPDYSSLSMPYTLLSAPIFAVLEPDAKNSPMYEQDFGCQHGGYASRWTNQNTFWNEIKFDIFDDRGYASTAESKKVAQRSRIRNPSCTSQKERRVVAARPGRNFSPTQKPLSSSASTANQAQEMARK